MKTRLLALCAALALPLSVLATPSAYAADTIDSTLKIDDAAGDELTGRFVITGMVATDRAACRTNRTVKLITVAPDLSRALYAKDTSGTTNHWAVDVPPETNFELIMTPKTLNTGEVCLGHVLIPKLKVGYFTRPAFPITGNTIFETYISKTEEAETNVIGLIDSNKGRCVEGRTVVLQYWNGERWKTAGSDTTAGSGDAFAISALAHVTERVVILPTKVGSVKCDRYVYPPAG